MEDQNSSSGTSNDVSQKAPSDELKNIKAEFNRKLENTNSQLQQILNALKTSNSQSSSSPEQSQNKRVSVFEDEDTFAKNVILEAEKRIDEKLQRQQQATSKYQTTVAEILRDYPEFQDDSGPLMSRAREIYSGLPEDERQSALAMKTAALQAAAEHGLKPKNKRSEDNNNFSLSGGASNNIRPQRSSKDSELDPMTLEFAKALGKDVNDPEYIKRLKSHAKRTDWKRYQ